jgi:homoserine kinase type II
MSVYTAVDHAALLRFLDDFDLGEPLGLEGILDGVENTNYFLDTTRGRHVLTLFESLRASELPFFFELMAWMAARGVPAPVPRLRRDGHAVGSLCGRPAAIVERLDGSCVDAPGEAHCEAVGGLLARLHLASAGFGASRTSARGRAWRAQVLARLAGHIDPGDLELMREEVARQDAAPFAALPAGVVHGDVFPDNVLFDGPRLTGIVDFYYAAHEAFVYDLAVACFGWCFDGNGYAVGQVRALLRGYRELRELQPAEVEAWPLALRAAALRFWLSRQHDACHAKPGQLVKVKDPAACRAALLAVRRDPATMLGVWRD